MTTDKELREQAAEQLETADDEILRLYEIIAIAHPLMEMYLENMPVAHDEDQQQGLNLIMDAKYAIEYGLTVAQARLIREEALVE